MGECQSQGPRSRRSGAFVHCSSGPSGASGPPGERWANGRWNPPRSFATLYLNANVATARLQVGRMLAGSPAEPDDLDDDAYLLIAATLPRAQVCADAVSPSGPGAIGLAEEYPLDNRGRVADGTRCQEVGGGVRQIGLRGVWCRSVLDPQGDGRELAWFPATLRSRAHPVWENALPYGGWRHAVSWGDIGFEDQPDPRTPPPRHGG